MPDEPTFPADILDTKTVQKFYAHTIAPAAKETGKLLADSVKVVRLFTAPLQLLAAGQVRFERWLDEVRAKVPPERQTEAPASIAGPVLMNLVFVEDDNPLRELYLNLLARAIDTERQAEAHPGFVKIIEQLSPEESKCLIEGIRAHHTGTRSDLPWWKLPHAKQVELMERFNALGICTHPAGQSLTLTQFGRRFVIACCPPEAVELLRESDRKTEEHRKRHLEMRQQVDREAARKGIHP